MQNQEKTQHVRLTEDKSDQFEIPAKNSQFETPAKNSQFEIAAKNVAANRSNNYERPERSPLQGILEFPFKGSPESVAYQQGPK